LHALTRLISITDYLTIWKLCFQELQERKWCLFSYCFTASPILFTRRTASSDVLLERKACRVLCVVVKINFRKNITNIFQKKRKGRWFLSFCGSCCDDHGVVRVNCSTYSFNNIVALRLCLARIPTYNMLWPFSMVRSDDEYVTWTWSFSVTTAATAGKCSKSKSQIWLHWSSTQAQYYFFVHMSS